MKTLLFYLLQVIVTSGILYGYYHFALRNKRFHRYNRYYLLAATILSITVPFLNIPVYFAQSATESSFVLETLTVISSAGSNNSIVFTQPDTEANWFTRENILLFIYMLVALIALLRIIFSVLKIRRIIRNNPVEPLDKIHFVNTDEPGTPFSFFRWLFWNKKIELQSEKGQQIFRHEVFHIDQKHSWDTIYMELLTVVFWINPFFYLIRKEVKAIHEFLADQFAVSENTKWQYAELLLMQALHTNQHLVNPFFHNQIKRRIAMITTSKKPSHQYLRKMMVLPVAATVIGLFAFTYKERQADKINQSSEILQVFSDTIIPKATDNKIFDRVEIEPSFPGGAALWRKYLEKNLDVSVPLKKKAPDGAYTVVVQFIVDKEGKISDAKPMTKHGYGMEEEAVRIIKAGPNWTPAVQNGLIVKAYRKQPITFVVGKGDKNFPSSVYNTGNELNEVVVTGFPSTGNTDNKIFDKVEIPPQFPGGALKWKQYLERNLDLTVPLNKKVQDGIYTVVVEFIVDKQGHISDVKALTNHGYGLEDEAIRVIKAGPYWIPAVQNGRQVKAYRKQPITFMVLKEDNSFPSKKITSIGNWLEEVVFVGYSSAAKTVNKIFDKVETPPHFPGGDTAWRRYLQKNINALVPVDSGAPAGIYKVIVQFIVNENGQLSDIKSITNHGYGMEKEAIRIIEDGPGWVPAMQNGHIVRAYVQQPVTFQVEEEANTLSTKTQNVKTVTNSYKTPEITLTQLKNSTAIQLMHLPEGSEIARFLVEIDDKNGGLIQSIDYGNKFSAKTKSLFDLLKVNDLIMISEIKTILGGVEKKNPLQIYRIIN